MAKQNKPVYTAVEINEQGYVTLGPTPTQEAPTLDWLLYRIESEAFHTAQEVMAENTDEDIKVMDDDYFIARNNILNQLMILLDVNVFEGIKQEIKTELLIEGGTNSQEKPRRQPYVVKAEKNS